ncbi:MAG TPA: elongation factor P--(R)-beta-lysine ligase [Aquifex aeolicus]|nr:elongation factor P--(R)-beta-lysine ligase [Aquificales bacterium]HIQ25756.1 elongation factor P--(R)-beta-lysine ligase [Aquifex aeolicus]
MNSPQSQIKKVEEFLSTLRDFMKKRGYTEVVTPYLRTYPNLDDNIFPLSCEVERPFSGRETLYLHTSPEYAMKKLLALYGKDIFQICHVFRNLEGGKLNDVEFLMLEYYKVGKDYRYLMEELEELLKVIFGGEIEYNGKRIPTRIKKISLKEAYKKYLRLDLELLLSDTEAFKKQLGEKGINFSPEEDGETLFFRTYVELGKFLGFDQPTVVYSFPQPFGALAKCKNGWCERFELYIFGIEMANAYTEVADEEEIKGRLWEVAKKLNLPLDGEFIKSHRRLPKLYSGISIGLDRLLMLKLGLNSIFELYYRGL